MTRPVRVDPLRTTLIPAALLLFSPPLTLLVWHTHVHHSGSITSLMSEFAEFGVLGTVARVWAPVLFGSPTAWSMIAIFAAVQLMLMRFLPGRAVRGPITPGGNVPAYKANGMPAFVVTLGLYLACSFGLGLFPAAVIYDHFGELLGALNIFSLILCLFLYLKGRFKPSTSDSGHSGNIIFDYFWGTELHPRVVGWDVKMFTNCRFGMMAWPLILVSFTAAQFARHGTVSASMAVAVGIQLLYIAKFFYWEAGYLQSMDITYDRAGFYICWGCLVWLPSIYTSSTFYLVDQSRSIGVAAAILLFAGGAVSVVVNYRADAQRRRVRDTNGKTTVWGKPPILVIGRYTTAGGERYQSLLLASGWWGISRHFHYVPEFLAALCWTLPVLFDNVLPYFYLAFLAILLTHRAFRDDNRCAAKYGADWDAYRQAVRWRIIPGVI